MPDENKSYAFITDTEAEYEYIKNFCEERGCEFALAEVWAKGGEGGEAPKGKKEKKKGKKG